MKILTPSQKLPENVGDLGKLIVAKGFKNFPKVQNIAQSGHTACDGKLQVTSQVLQPKTVNRWFGGRHTFISVHWQGMVKFGELILPTKRNIIVEQSTVP